MLVLGPRYEIRKEITKLYPSLDIVYIPFVFAVNHKVVGEEVPVTHLDEIATSC
ncbi:MAG: hypothetical protein ABJB85_10810 [Nitrososphaerota archaeon]